MPGIQENEDTGLCTALSSLHSDGGNDVLKGTNSFN